MKKLLLTCAAALALGLTSSHAAVYTLSGLMDPQQAGTNGGFGGGAGSGTGTISGSYDDVANILAYTVSWQNLSAPVTVSHFHNAPPGASGGVRVTISGGASTTATFSASPVISDTFEGQLLAGDWYVNVHTGNFSGGEIRGQVITTLIPEPGTSALALGALGLLVLRRRRA